MTELKNFLESKRLYYIFFFILILLSFRNLFLPLQGDENTYNEIAVNILEGRYYQNNNPSTVIPVIPFLMAFFSTPKFPVIGFALHKLFHIGLCIIGLRFAFLTFKKLSIEPRIIYSLLLLTSISSGFLSYVPGLYPEAIVFFSFWGFLYYFNEPKTFRNFKKLFFLIILLVFTRYVYAVLGILILMYYYTTFFNYKVNFYKIIIVSAILSAPLLLWLKYIYNIESQSLSEISYFNRFKSVDSPIWHNLKCGLGIEQHYETNRINGIPAFISLFIPITGIRNYLISSFLILAVFFGLYQNHKNKIVLNLLIAFSLVFLGLIFAGTGFSRYWFALLPIIYLSYYYVFLKFFKNLNYFLAITQIISFILILNEIRLTFTILKKI